LKLEVYKFEEAQGWFYPKIKSIMNVTDARTVVDLPEDNATVHISKIIPLPTFLVPLFMNKGQPQSTVASFQAFMDEVFEAATNLIKKYTQYIFDFLLAASGSKDDNDQKDMVSQLAISIEEVELNPTMMQWASTHFSSVKKITLQHNKQIEKEQVQQASNVIIQ